MIDNEVLDRFVNEVRERSDIYNVISRYVSLKLRSGQYWGCCPFHNEKTPSFTVSPTKGFFYCFGCHKGGNVFKFISLMENISYFDAVKLQAERLGIKFPRQNRSNEEIEKYNQEKRLFKVNENAKSFYHNCLMKTSYGEIGRKYLKSRGISKETLEEFEIGFAPDSWDSLSKALMTKKGFKEEELIKVGLSSARKNTSGVYDKFRKRIMIPIADLYGRIVAFGGRVVNGNEEPKYLNSPDTILFSKKNLLFNLNRATKYIQKMNYVIIVEGYMDVISVYSAGIGNVVASMGTAFSEEQAKLLMRYTRRIYFCYDNDEAGQRATMRALEIFSKLNAEIKVIKIPEAKDPDEYIKNNGVEEFKKLIETASPMIEYQLKVIFDESDPSTLEGKRKTIGRLIPILSKTKDLTLKNGYIKRIANFLVLEEELIYAELDKYDERKYDNQKTKLKPKNFFEDSLQVRAERILLMVLWQDIDLFTYVDTVLTEESFTLNHKEIYKYLKKCYENQKEPNDVSSGKELSDESIEEMSRMLLEYEFVEDDKRKIAFKDSLRVVRLSILRTKYHKCVEEIREITKDPDYYEKSEYHNKLKETLKIKKEMDELKFE